MKVIFIEYVHRHPAKYACEVTRDQRYVCPECGKPVKDFDAVFRRLEDKKSRQIIFAGEKLDMEAVYRVRDGFFPPERKKARSM